MSSILHAYTYSLLSAQFYDIEFVSTSILTGVMEFYNCSFNSQSRVQGVAIAETDSTGIISSCFFEDSAVDFAVLNISDSSFANAPVIAVSCDITYALFL